jgi:hypothetical protein
MYAKTATEASCYQDVQDAGQEKVPLQFYVNIAICIKESNGKFINSRMTSDIV